MKLYTEQQYEKAKVRDLLEMQCDSCLSVFKRTKREIYISIKFKTKNDFCSQKCKGNKNKLGEILNCKNCNTPTYKSKSDLLKNKNHFCCHKCSSCYYNSLRTPMKEEQKMKISNTLKNKYPSTNSYCIICKKHFKGTFKGKKTCSVNCLKLRQIENGKNWINNSTVNRRGRSRNEGYFAKLIKNDISNVITNKRMFNGFDADIILLDQKIAIHWNGPFHYRQIFTEEHFNNIKHRDELRYEEIKKCGFTNYIINDSDNKGFNKAKVEYEATRFLSFLKNI